MKHFADQHNNSRLFEADGVCMVFGAFDAIESFAAEVVALLPPSATRIDLQKLKTSVVTKPQD
jgi:hypothetical protein